MKHKLAVLALAAITAITANINAYAFGGGSSPHGGAAGAAEKKGGAAEGPSPVMGKVVETMNSGGYTYVLLENKGNKIWVAMPETKVKVGEDVVFGPGQEMVNFRSDTLKRTFDRIIFSSGPMALPGTMGDKSAKPKPTKGASVKVEKATGKNAYTVSELYSNRTKLDNKGVTVRGKVVKVSANIMGKTWIHIQDGTGSAEQGTHNLVCTTSTDNASVGDTVTVTGVLKKDKDFGYGYKYDVMLEDATVTK